MRFWPRTLGMQLIAVTAAAEFVSNVAVAIWFELGSQRLTESAITERVLDRAASTATLLNAIPARSRAAAARAMGSPAWQFDIRVGKDTTEPISSDEAKLAQRLRSM